MIEIPVTTAMRKAAARFGFKVKGAVLSGRTHLGEAVPGSAFTLDESDVECPYCHQLMAVLHGSAARIVGFIDPRQTEGVRGDHGLAEVPPAGTVMLICGECEQSFFQPAAGDHP